MLQYLIVQLDDTSASFCHYSNERKNNRLIPLSILEKAIIWSMKENLKVQFIYPDYEIPIKYKDAINEIDHIKIVGFECKDEDIKANSDVIIFNGIREIDGFLFRSDTIYIIRDTFENFFENENLLKVAVSKAPRINLQITNITSLTQGKQIKYSDLLNLLGTFIKKEFLQGNLVQVNTLTDILMLNKMNNCNAGNEHLTLAPDGNFYICPAFYLNNLSDGFCGNLETGIKIKNERLYKLSQAPICRKCDAYHCKRCVWLNQLQTLEINTPGKEQCITSHLERNAAKKFLSLIKDSVDFIPDKEIPEIDYLDPFEQILKIK